MIRSCAGLLAAMAVAGCASTSGGTAAPATAATTAAPEASRCLDVPPEKLAAIADGAEDGVGQLVVSHGAAVQSRSFKKIYMIAATVSGNGFNNETGVWASNELSDGGLMMSVDGFAKEFTVWPDADKTDAGISQSDDGVAEAKACL